MDRTHFEQCQTCATEEHLKHSIHLLKGTSEEFYLVVEVPGGLLSWPTAVRIDPFLVGHRGSWQALLRELRGWT